MKQIWIPRTGGPDVLELRESPDPEPAAGEVRVRVKAAGVNFADVVMRMGLYRGAGEVPCVPGYEVAGRIEAAGAGVAGLSVGDPVVVGLRSGGYSDVAVVPESQAMRVPANVSLEAAATLPVNYVTAWLMLVWLGNVRRRERVVIHSAGGGVGLAAMQIARWRGAEIIGLASAWKHERLREAGVDHCIDYTAEDFAPRVMELTGGRGADVVLDSSGGDSFRKSYRCLAPLGRLFLYGAAGLAPARTRRLLPALSWWLRLPRFRPLRLMMENRAVFGVHVGQLWERRDVLQEIMEDVLYLTSDGTLRPVVDRTFPLEEAAAAHAYLQDRRNFGKVLLTP
jgi:NADPH:quinone reductase-like Zn-dependent oxidoreductase